MSHMTTVGREFTPIEPYDLDAALDRQEEREKEKLFEQQEDLDELSKQLRTTHKEGIYNYINEIDAKSFFNYYVILIIVFLIVNRIKFNLKHVIAGLIGLVVVYYLNDKRKTTQTTEMQTLELKLLRIFPKPQYFHLDAGIVELVYSIQEFKQYNETSYNAMIKSIDNFLKVVYDIENGVADCNGNYEIAKKMKQVSLNNLASLIYRTPTDFGAEQKLRDATKSLHFILNVHLENLRKICNKKYKKDGPNIYNSFIENSKVEATDPYYNNRFDVYN
jgi:hypothetical protein